MLLGLHTYSLYLHGIGQAWADFKLPWPRQMNTFELFDQAVRWGLDGLHLDDGVLESLEKTYLKEVRAAAEANNLYLEYNFSMDLGGQGIGIQHDPAEAITTAESLGADIVARNRHKLVETIGSLLGFDESGWVGSAGGRGSPAILAGRNFALSEPYYSPSCPE